MKPTEEIIEEVVEDEYEPEPTVVDIVVGSWREALAEDGINRVILVMLVASMTIGTPVLFAIMILAWVGVI